MEDVKAEVARAWAFLTPGSDNNSYCSDTAAIALSICLCLQTKLRLPLKLVLAAESDCNSIGRRMETPLPLLLADCGGFPKSGFKRGGGLKPVRKENSSTNQSRKLEKLPNLGTEK